MAVIDPRLRPALFLLGPFRAALVVLAFLSLSCAGCGSSGEGWGAVGGGAAEKGGTVGGGWEEEAVLAAEAYRFEDLEPFPGGAVTVLALPSGNPVDPERLAAGLSAAVEAMARRVPLDPDDPGWRPLTVALERNHPQQIAHAGDVGEAVPGGPADVHLVYHPEDGFAYRHALARRLVERAGLDDGLPPYLRLGAAWWLVEAGAQAREAGGAATDTPAGEGGGAGGTAAEEGDPATAEAGAARGPKAGQADGAEAGAARRRDMTGADGVEAVVARGREATGADGAEAGAAGARGAGGDPALWYGRSRQEWLPRLAAAGVLPSVDELLAVEEPADGSRLLWTPVAAAVVGSLPGETLAEKLAATEDRLRAQAARLLADLDAPGPDRAAPGPDRAAPGQDRDAAGEDGRGAAPGPAWTGGDGGLGRPVGERPGGLPGRVAAGVPRDPLPPFLAGVSLAMLNQVELGYHAPSVDAALVNLRRAVAANAVSLMPFAYQRRPDEPRLVYLNRRPRSETDAAMIHAGRRAGVRGLTVLWKPQIWLAGSWPGEVAMGSEEEWQRWFRTYRRFLVHQAVLADRVGAEIFSVGVELGRTVERTADWHRVIDAVERFYDGPLTYSANWYGDFDRVTFWDRLDFLGMDAYEPLSEDPQASDDDLAAGARRVVAGMAAAVEEHGKPLLLTEVGFAAHEAAWVAPHEEGGPLSPRDQARAYRALLGALAGARFGAGEPPGRPPEWLAGLFLWKAFSSGPHGPDGQEIGERGEDFADFRFLGRPAQEVVHDHFTAYRTGGDRAVP